MNHIPVLINEVIKFVEPKNGDLVVDLTFGAGGYSKKLLDSAQIVLIAFDKDPETQEFANSLSPKYADRFSYVNRSYADLEHEIQSRMINEVDAIVMDLGVSSMQLDRDYRGFSFSKEAKLDMRMSMSGRTALEFINEESEEFIANVIYSFGDERFSRRIAKAITLNRKINKIETTTQLREIVAGAIPKKFWGKKIDPATKTFQAIRIFINNELDELKLALLSAINLLKVGGKLVVVSFHSLEDRIVKFLFNKLSKGSETISRYVPSIGSDKDIILNLISKGVVKPTKEEIERNPRSRSARLRACIKVKKGKRLCLEDFSFS